MAWRRSGGRSQAVVAVRTSVAAAAMEKQASRHTAGCLGERAVCGALSSLALSGVQHLDDRRSRGDTKSLVNLDHLVIAPAGVFVIDAKNWAGSVQVRGSSLLQDGAYRDQRLLALRWMTSRVEEWMATSLAAHVRPQSVVCFARPTSALPPAVGTIHLTDLSRLGSLLCDRPAVLTATQVHELSELLAYAFPPYDVDDYEAAEAEGLLFPDSVTRHAGLGAALTRPVEDWMVWLHPEQAHTVHRSFAGPARVRGAAGTGKTCVGLHRVAHLATTRPGRFLVTSFVKTLPPALERSYGRLSPKTASRVDFVHVHAVALELLRDRGIPVRADLGHAAWNAAWRNSAGSLKDCGLSSRYFQEEVTYVLKGRGLSKLADYLALERVGRRTPLQPEQRQQVWRLAEVYDSELAARGQTDLTDVLRLARDELRRVPCARWAGVMVDEAQDLPMVGLQLLHELAGRDRTDGLLLIGDGQQAIYPGGFRLRDAGISVLGRAVVLRLNYRNTVEVLATAKAVVAGDSYDDMDLVSQDSDRDVEVSRHGDLPAVTLFPTQQQQDAAMLWDLQVLLDRGGEMSEIAVLTQTNAQAERYLQLLTSAGVRAVLLKSGGTEPGVRVGTWFRSKGMEYAHVFVPSANLDTQLLTGAGRKARDEKAELLRRTLYVAMTRARDTLWVGHVGSWPEGSS